jgi:hypothetical protein
VIIHHLDLVGVAVAPDETDPPLVVHPNAPLTRSIASELLESVPGGRAEVIETDGCVEHPEFAEPGAPGDFTHLLTNSR